MLSPSGNKSMESRGGQVFELLTRHRLEDLLPGADSTRQQHGHGICIISRVNRNARKRYLKELRHLRVKSVAQLTKLARIFLGLTSLDLSSELGRVWGEGWFGWWAGSEGRGDMVGECGVDVAVWPMLISCVPLLCR